MKNTDYELLVKQVEAVKTEYLLSFLCNVTALINESLEDLNWAGFYFVKDDKLILGPFQGKVACVEIAKGKGVCGTAWAKDETILVPDVHRFPGHIACDSASNSEIVIPIHKDHEVIAVLDIDSPLYERFKEEDKEGLEKIVSVIEEAIGDMPSSGLI
ncbi:MAG: GAF domain-containing protein [Erysipelotrichaceae bacterium]|nr:GAF domain-containing protein [Erysipelotrichaceae bacterium]